MVSGIPGDGTAGILYGMYMVELELPMAGLGVADGTVLGITIGGIHIMILSAMTLGDGIIQFM